MTPTLLARESLARDETFRRKTLVAMVKASLAIAAEATATPHHAQRREYAVRALRDPARFAPDFASAVAATSGITDERLGGVEGAAVWTGTDADLEFLVASVYDALAVTDDSA
jgi:ClpP class serine protease